MRFADIPGHEEVKARLRHMVDSGRLPHALLLEGPSGCGKFALARATAQYLHCERRTINGDSCGMCPSCLQHQSFNHIDTVYSFPVVKKKGKKTLSDDCIEDFRDFMRSNPYMDFDKWLETLDNINAQPQIYVEEGTELLRRLTFMSRKSEFKVVLLWLPERMMVETANKLLKLVEEPYADTKFIMVSNNAREILPTIYSRSQRIEIKRYSDEELAFVLKGMGIEADTAADLAKVAQGNVNEALKLSGLATERTKMLEYFTSLMRKAYARKVKELREWSQEVATMGREPIMQFLDYSSRLFRESFLMHLAVEDLLTMSKAEREFVNRFFPFINERNVMDLLSLFDRAKNDISYNGNSKIILFDLAIRVIILLRR